MAAAIVAYFGYVIAVQSRYEPPAGVVDMRTFLARMPAPEEVCEFSTETGTFWRFRGETPPALVMASGPPTYVFDESGALVDWVVDEGEDSRFQARWMGRAGERWLSEEEIAEFVARVR